VHTTTTGNKIKAMKREALELTRGARTVMKAAKTLPDAREKAHKLKAEALAIKL
jgi:hypothetical protein